MQPTIVRASYHDWEHIKDYTDSHVKKMDGSVRPIVWNARGTHATYFSPGRHPPIFDWSSSDTAWDLWLSLDMVFPWDWIDGHRFNIETDSNLEGLNYLTQVYKWGNKGMGIEVKG